MGQLKLIATLMFIALFSMAIVGYAINFAGDNNAVISLDNEDGFDTFTSEVQTDIIDLKNEVNSSSKAISEADIGDASGTINRPAIFETMGDFPKVLNLIINLVKQQFGNNPIITFAFTLLSIFIGISVVLYFWKTFKGSPD